MAVTEAQKRAVRKYCDKNYDRLDIRVPKGKKEEYQAKAQQQGKSLRQYIMDKLDE